MKKIFAFVVAAIMATSAMAVEVDTRDLTDAQKAALQAQIEQLKTEKSDPQNISKTVRHEAEAWGELGGNMGKALVGAAKEIGVAANDFAGTSLGKVTVGVVIYKLMGKDIVSMITGGFILIFGFAMSTWIITTRRWSKVQYEYIPVLWGAFQRRRVVSSDTDGDVVVGKLIGICFAITLLVGLKTMF